MDAKQHRCSSLSRPRKKAAVCMVGLRSLDDRNEYVLYLIDLNSPPGSSSSNSRRDDDEFIPRHPTFVADQACFGDASFCTFRSKIYIFQGLKFSKEAPTDLEPKPVYRIDVSPSDLKRFNINLKKKNLAKVDEMLHPKTVPMAILTPDKTKILVFSCYVRRLPKDNIDFELYDPVTGSWSSLPPLCERPLWVEAYGFVNDTILFIKTDAGMFSLKFQLPDEDWKREFSFNNDLEDDIGYGLFYTIGDEFCLTPTGYFDMGENARYAPCHDHPLSWIDSRGCCMSSDIALVDDGDGEDFVVVQISEPEDVEARVPRVVVDVCRGEVSEYRKEKRRTVARIPTTRVRCLSSVWSRYVIGSSK